MQQSVILYVILQFAQTIATIFIATVVWLGGLYIFNYCVSKQILHLRVEL